MAHSEIGEYWEKRATQVSCYRGEQYYTLTPLPLYHRRRAILVARLDEILSGSDGATILDFGCGDGYYAVRFSKQFRRHRFFGCDISETMIDKARELNKICDGRVTLSVTEGPIPFPEKFDIILAVAVLAHVMEAAQMREIVEDFWEHLAEGGKVIIFESTANTPRSGNTWNRRTEQYYERMFESVGFHSIRTDLVAFPFFTMVDRILFSRARSGVSRLGYQANQNRVYLWLCERAMSLSERFDRHLRPSEGNSFFVFAKAP